MVATHTQTQSNTGNN